MTTKTSFPECNKMSKADEIVWLQAAAAAAGPDSYVRDFLSPEAVGWAASKIRDDFAPDLYRAYTYEHEQRALAEQKILDERSTAKCEVARITQKAEIYEAADERKTATINSLETTIHELEQRHCKLIDDLDTETRLRETWERRWVEQNQTVTELKAKLYDLMVMGAAQPKVDPEPECPF